MMMGLTRRHGVLAAVLLASVAVVAGLQNATEGQPSIGGLKLTDVIAQLEKGEAAAHGALTAGWSWILDHFSHFVIAGPLTFVFHELVYFGAWMPWLLLAERLTLYSTYFSRGELNFSFNLASPTNEVG